MADSRFSKKNCFSLARHLNFKKISCIVTSSCRHEPPYDTHHGEVINRAKFDVCTCSSFKEVKTERRIH